MKKIVFIFLFSLLLVAPAGSLGAKNFTFGPEEGTPTTFLDNIAPQCRATGNCTLCDAFKVVATVMQWLLGTIAALALFFLIFGGFSWLTSAGNQEEIQKGKKMIVGSILGMLIVLAAWTLISIIIAILITPGFDLKTSQFKDYQGNSIFKSPNSWATIKCGPE